MNRLGVLDKAFTAVPVMLLVFFIMIIFLAGTVTISKLNKSGLPEGGYGLFVFSVKNESNFVPLGARVFDTFVHYSYYPSTTATSSKMVLSEYFAKKMNPDTCFYLDIEEPAGQKDFILHVKDFNGNINEMLGKISNYRLKRGDIADEVKYSLVNQNGDLVDVHYFFYYGKCLGGVHEDE